MWDRITNYVTTFVRDLKSTHFIILASVFAVLGFYFLGLFLKAIKKRRQELIKLVICLHVY
jgi:hypothetical protein